MKTILVDANDAITVNGQLNIEMYKMLETFPNKKIILTNASDDQFAKYGLDKAPYEVYSLRHNPEKLDPNYYKKMLNDYDLIPSDVIYFDHVPEVVISAQSVGITTYFYDPVIRDIESLKKFIINNI